MPSMKVISEHWCFGGSLNRQDTHGSCDTARRLITSLALAQLLVTLVVHGEETIEYS